MITIEDLPGERGNYVAYVDNDVTRRFAERKLLHWDGARWFYPLSDQRFRGPVYGCIGPIPSMELHD